MEINHRNIKVVLVEPLGQINLGSVARLCENFGIKELRLVSPKCELLGITTRKMALKGIKLIKNAHCYSNLLEAVQDCVRVVATCGRKDHGEIPLTSAKSSLSWLLETNLNDSTAIVFGREDRGLTNEELLLAQKVITIPTPSNYPSLNISHAVAIVLYELTNCMEHSKRITNQKTYNMATPKELNDYLSDVQEFLLKVGFLYPHTALSRIAKIKSLLHRAEVRSEEISMLRGMLRQYKWFIDKKDV